MSDKHEDDFSKIIRVDGRQVLFWVEVDPEDDDRYKLHQQTRIDGIAIDISGGGIDMEIDEILALATEEQARVIVEAATSLLDGSQS